MNTQIKILKANHDEKTILSLTDILISCVEAGASVGFMLPLSRDKIIDFWSQALSSADKGERIILVALDKITGALIGTVQIILNLPENQPHRADIAKMLVHPNARKQGVGAALLHAIDQVALSEGRHLLVLDTVTGSDAERLYTRHGWKRVGDIPGYALWPEGELCSTTLFYRKLNRK